MQGNLFDFSVVFVLGHERNTDFIAMFDAYLPAGDYCGQRKPISGQEKYN